MNGMPAHTEHGLFVDDTTLWTSGNTTTSLSSSTTTSHRCIRKLVQVVEIASATNKNRADPLQLSAKEAVQTYPVTVNLDNTSIKPLESTRYLGVIIDKQLQWRSHLDNIERKIAPRMGLLRYLSRDQHMTLITRR